MYITVFKTNTRKLPLIKMTGWSIICKSSCDMEKTGMKGRKGTHSLHCEEVIFAYKLYEMNYVPEGRSRKKDSNGMDQTDKLPQY